MITSLRIKNKSLTDTITLVPGENFLISSKQNKINFSASISSNSSSSYSIPYLTTIQGVNSTSESQFYILGDLCTSITDNIDKSDPQCISQSNTFSLYDGCTACSQCDKYEQLKNNIYECYVWLSGLKDCQLYYQQGAAKLWQQMKTQIPGKSINCNIESKLDKWERSQEFGKAVKLLYQYKAAVAMWNYIVFTKTKSLQVIKASQDYGAFIVQCKKSIDTCTSDSSTVLSDIELQFDIELLQGQLPQLLAQTFENMSLYVTSVSQNTYIQYGTDSGASILENSTIYYQGVPNPQISVSYQLYTGPKIHAVVIFTPKQKCKAVFSGSFKVIPVITGGSDSTVPQSSLISLADFAAMRTRNTAIDLSQQVMSNVWKIQSGWTYDIGKQHVTADSTKQTKLFSTSFSMHGQRSDSSSAIIQ